MEEKSKVNISLLIECAITCSDFPIIRMVVIDSNSTTFLNGKNKDSILSELNSIMNNVSKIATEEEEKLKIDCLEVRSMYSMIYHTIASYIEQEMLVKFLNIKSCRSSI